MRDNTQNSNNSTHQRTCPKSAIDPCALSLPFRSGESPLLLQLATMSTWDSNVALAFAAEEPLVAAQAITSESISKEQPFGIAHSRVRILSEHGRSLPSDIVDRIAVLDDSYTDRENSGATHTVGAMAIVAATLDLLGDVQNRLLQSERKQGVGPPRRKLIR